MSEFGSNADALIDWIPKVVAEPNRITLRFVLSENAPGPMVLIVPGKIGTQPAAIPFFLKAFWPISVTPDPNSMFANEVAVPKLSAIWIRSLPSIRVKGHPVPPAQSL